MATLPPGPEDADQEQQDPEHEAYAPQAHPHGYRLPRAPGRELARPFGGSSKSLWSEVRDSGRRMRP